MKARDKALPCDKKKSIVLNDNWREFGVSRSLRNIHWIYPAW